MRRSALSLISARNAGSLMAPTGPRRARRPVPGAVAAGARAGEHAGPLVQVPALGAGRAEVRRYRFPGRSRSPALLDPFGQHLDLGVGQRAAPARAKAGIALLCAAVTARPSEMTCRNSASGTMARKTGSFSGGAGPSLPSAPWQPAQCAP